MMEHAETTKSGTGWQEVVRSARTSGAASWMELRVAWTPSAHLGAEMGKDGERDGGGLGKGQKTRGLASVSRAMLP